MKKQDQQSRSSHIVRTSLLIILGLFLLSSALSSLGKEYLHTHSGNVAVISITGPISSDDSVSLFSSSGATPNTIIPLLQAAEDDDATEAIVLSINSPGGTPVATDEIARAVKDIQKPVVAVIHESGASGAYWIASATDYIIANRMSITGSIGVYASYLDFSGLMNRYNVSYQRLVAGEYKDAGVPFRALSATEESLIQAKLDRMRDIFIEEVAHNRNLSIGYVGELANGMYYLGEEAQQNGLIDKLGGEQEASEYLQGTYNITAEYYVLEPERSWSDLFSQVLSKHGYAVGTGVGTSLTKTEVKV